jgi:alpha-tubulin suppressor-like RCC1 family protein
VSVIGIDNASQITAGNSSSCALISGGAVKCWGANYEGQLGNDPADFEFSDSPVFVKYESGTNLSEAIQLTGAKTWEHYCVRYSSGIAECWGDNEFGELGVGTSGDIYPFPIQVSEITDFAFIAAGWNNTCGQRVNGTVYCWGNNEEGQIGDGTFNDKSTPGSPLNLSGITQIDPGDLLVCALISGNTVYCWGENNYGQVGDGTTSLRTTPVLVNW